MRPKRNYVIGIISGFFNPLHAGHIEYINDSSELCDILIVIINNDYQVKLKGSKPFMDVQHRRIIINALKKVNKTYISTDQDSSVCETLKQVYKENVFDNIKCKFFNSGDRTNENINSKEKKICEELGIEFVLINKPKIYSSSQLLSR